MYKTVVIEYSPKADNMAEKIEEKANEMLQQEYELVTMSVTTTAKAILVFKKQTNKFSSYIPIALKKWDMTAHCLSCPCLISDCPPFGQSLHFTTNGTVKSYAQNRFADSG